MADVPVNPENHVSTDAASSEAVANTVKEVKEVKEVKIEKTPKPEKPAPPPDPRALEAIAAGQKVQASLVASLGEGTVLEVGASKEVPVLLIDRSKWKEAMTFLKEDQDHAYDYMELFTGTDYKDYIEVIVYLYSTVHHSLLCLKTRTQRDAASVPSITSLYAGANWEEREVYDLLGVEFVGHPDLRRIMMWEGWNGHPLRKDFSEFENMPERAGGVKS